MCTTVGITASDTSAKSKVGTVTQQFDGKAAANTVLSATRADNGADISGGGSYFEAAAVNLVVSSGPIPDVAGKSVAEVARLLEVSDQSIYSWRRQELVDRGELPGLSSLEREELRAARRRIRELETELAVHRRAAEVLKEEVRPKGASRRSQ